MDDVIIVYKSISLTSEDADIVSLVSKERRFFNFSLALRQIIQEWAKENNVLPPSPTNGNGADAAAQIEKEK